MKMLWMAAVLALTGCVSTQTHADDGILIIGDSISMGYTPYVQKKLPCVAHTMSTRNPDHMANNLSTRAILKNIDATLAGKHYRIIHVNAGMWDAAHRSDLSRRKDKLYNITKAPLSVPIGEYASNLGEIFSKLQAHADTVIWATITDVPPNSVGRLDSEVEQYNKEARYVAHSQYGLPVDDLRRLMADHDDLHVGGANKVHYSAAGYALLGAHVAEVLRAHGGCATTSAGM